MTAREDVIRTITSRPLYDNHTGVFDKAFGENLFHEEVQKKLFPQPVFEALQKIIKRGDELTLNIANQVAKGMSEWARSKGATHFCHWFQPLTDQTAEKHDTLFSPDSKGSMIASFSGKELIRGEPDASSFPSGGLRATFEARGYTAWDPSSPPFIIKRTLVIPTVFLSWTGDALDKKTPLLRSMEALNTQALRILRLFGDEQTERVFPTVGAEQEYFLIDTLFFNMRPDLLSTGRTLFGAKPPKGQELEDQYLGTIPERVLQIMEETEYELIRLGVPVLTRHNEVAPSQYELAVVFEPANLATDHQMIVMEMLKSVAARRGMTCLLHEKPFAGINGSGKHNNWSMATNLGHNLLEPGNTPHENAEFLLFCAAVLQAVHRYASLLLLGVADPGNDHRLGRHEAPPGIISVFLGEQLHDIFQRIVTGKSQGEKQHTDLEIGVSMLPKIPRHSSDRNRTSPFAFTGNKFEFRAVGSSANIAKSNTHLNTMVADSLQEFAQALEKGIAQGIPFNEVLQTVLSNAAADFLPILFEGDNYSEDWHREAKKRKLPNITNTVDAAIFYTSQEAISLFTRFKVMTRKELESRQEILLSKYVKKIHIEARTALSIGHTQIVPAVIKYIAELGRALNYLANNEHDLLKSIAKEFNAFRKVLKAIDDAYTRIPSGDILEQATYMRDKILTLLERLRCYGDNLERLVDDKLWPLPKYREMLFIR